MTLMKKPSKKNQSPILEEFYQYIADEQLQQNYNNFIKVKSIIEVRVERYNTQINSLLDNINKHKGCIVEMVKLGYTDVPYLVAGLIQLETELSKVIADLDKSKTELDTIIAMIEKYDNKSDKAKETYWRILVESGDIKQTWLEFEEEFKDKIF